MKTNVLVLVVSCVLMAIAAPAMADEQAPVATSLAAEFTPEQIRKICRDNGYAVRIGNAHLEGGEAGFPAARPENMTPAATATATATVSTGAENCGECCDRLQSQINALKDGLARFRGERERLERRVMLLERNPRHADAAASVRVDLSEVNAAQAAFVAEVNARLESEFGRINERFARVKRVNARQDSELQALRDVNSRQEIAIGVIADNDHVQDALLDAQHDVDQMQNEEISDLRRERKYAEVGLNVGVLTLAGWDYTNVSGMVGGQLALRVGGRWYLMGAPSLLITGGNRPFGATFQLGVGYDLVEDRDNNGIVDSSYAAASVEFGGMLTSTLMNNQLEGKYVTVEPTVGLVVRFGNGFRAGGYVHGGPRTDVNGNLAATIGGILNLGYDFGSRH